MTNDVGAEMWVCSVGVWHFGKGWVQAPIAEMQFMRFATKCICIFLLLLLWLLLTQEWASRNLWEWHLM